MTNIDLKNKLLYRSIHRGCKETDFLLGKFGESNIENMTDNEHKIFDEFLNEDDMLIYDWILAKQIHPSKYDELVQDIRKFHNIS